MSIFCVVNVFRHVYKTCAVYHLLLIYATEMKDFPKFHSLYEIALY